MAEDVEDLLKKLDGFPIIIGGEEVTLRTADRELVTFAPDWRTELLGIITNPNVAYILMLIGIYGIIFEFWNPGFVLPGVVGAISLLLALYAFQVLPVNYAGLALIALGIAMMVGEMLMPSFGTLGIGGVVAFVVGSIMLMDTDAPGFGISWQVVGGVALAASALAPPPDGHAGAQPPRPRDHRTGGDVGQPRQGGRLAGRRGAGAGARGALARPRTRRSGCRARKSG